MPQFPRPRPLIRSWLSAAVLAVIATSASAAPEWQPDTFYATGSLVAYKGQVYRALLDQKDWSATGWTPTTKDLWVPVSTGPAPTPVVAQAQAQASVLPAPPPSVSSEMIGACTVWQPGATYVGGQYAALNGKAYVANWWTQDSPASASGPAGSGKPWTAVSSCAAGAAPVPSSTQTVAPKPIAAPVSTPAQPIKTATTVAPAPAPAPAPTAAPAPAPAPAPIASPSANFGLKSDQTRRIYTGYYASWSAPWFSAENKSLQDVYNATTFASLPATYTHVMVAFATPNFRWTGLSTDSWDGTGIGFSSKPSDVKAAIQVLKQRNIKVVLAVGGATYNDWDGLAAEGAAGSGSITTALSKMMVDLGFDGLDVDYEIEGA
ncbi:MAG: carbohydrate-binding protein, partial [Burkholderiaceae bacterium]